MAMNYTISFLDEPGCDALRESAYGALGLDHLVSADDHVRGRDDNKQIRSECLHCSGWGI